MKPLEIGMRVRCHKNLHNGFWAITQRGKVIAYVTEVVLADVTCVYYEALRVKAVAMHRRKVCAWMQGTLATLPASGARTEICFNPFRAATFTLRSGAAVARCQYVHFATDGRAYAMGVVE